MMSTPSGTLPAGRACRREVRGDATPLIQAYDSRRPDWLMKLLWPTVPQYRATCLVLRAGCPADGC